MANTTRRRTTGANIQVPLGANAIGGATATTTRQRTRGRGRPRTTGVQHMAAPRTGNGTGKTTQVENFLQNLVGSYIDAGWLKCDPQSAINLGLRMANAASL